MTGSFRFGFFAAVALLIARPVVAQDRPVVSLVPDDLPRWDVAGHVGWLGVNKSNTAPGWSQWYDVASFGSSVGFSWTNNVKIELDVSTTTKGDLFVQEQFLVPGESTPRFRFGEQRFRSTSIGGGLVYQFYENRWFHPFLGAGIEVTRESMHADLRLQPICVSLPCPPFVSLPAETSVTHAARPFAIGGFKSYVSERAFIRSDIQFSFSTEGAATVRWRVGIGVDF